MVQEFFFLSWQPLNSKQMPLLVQNLKFHYQTHKIQLKVRSIQSTSLNLDSLNT